jgi:uncharacterized protein (TIGR00255 family)
MVLSMTGYGQASEQYGDKSIMVEIRTLNSRATDLKMRFPPYYREREMDIRKLLLNELERGKVEVAIEVQSASGDEACELNETLFKAYHKKIAALQEALGVPFSDPTLGILRIPNVIDSTHGQVEEAEWSALQKALKNAMKMLGQFRREEGRALEADFRLRITNIMELLDGIASFEQNRLERVKARLRQNLDDFLKNEKLDANRFEQEIIYYLEKMDFTEEKTRLAQHCKYFMEQLDNDNSQTGRTLNFISQEIGREINTIGSKANDHDIQRLVVQMKDELEKIKEQCANIL